MKNFFVTVGVISAWVVINIFATSEMIEPSIHELISRNLLSFLGNIVYQNGYSTLLINLLLGTLSGYFIYKLVESNRRYMWPVSFGVVFSVFMLIAEIDSPFFSMEPLKLQVMGILIASNPLVSLSIGTLIRFLVEHRLTMRSKMDAA